jgi:hypothetical protein
LDFPIEKEAQMDDAIERIEKLNLDENVAPSQSIDKPRPS